MNDRPGSAAAEQPGVVGVVEYDGRMSDERRATIEQAALGWIGRAWASVPGAVRLLIMWDPEARASRGLTIAVSEDAAEAAGRAITAASAGADPEAATAPDRGSHHRVDFADRPEVAAPAAGTR